MNAIHIFRGKEYHTVLFVSNKQLFQAAACITKNNDLYSCVHASSLPFVSISSLSSWGESESDNTELFTYKLCRNLIH